MLTFEQIKEYFTPELVRLNPKGILVEYLQYEFLDSFFKQTKTEKLSFIGGTAIRFIYNSQRFSEDLDFDNFGLNFNEFKFLTEKACQEIKIKGFKIEHRFLMKNKTFHCYIKFPEIMQQYNLPAHHQEKIFISIDAEKKRKIIEPEIKTLNKFGIFRKILVNPASILLSQKLIAIFYRKREKGRDFYDVSFLGGLTRPDYSYIEKRTETSAKEFRRKFLKRCLKFNYKALAEDVAPFLFNTEQEERILSFGDIIGEIL